MRKQLTTGQKIRAARKKQGSTLAVVSELAGVTLPQLSRIERDQVEATVTTLRRIAKALGIKAGTLI